MILSRVFRVAFWQCLLALSLAWAIPGRAAERSTPLKMVSAVYSRPGGYPLKLDLYLPAPAKAAQPAPVVLWLHGGGWKYGWKGFSFFVRDLTAYGFAVATANYRLSTRADFPAQIEDTEAALAWLRAHHHAYGLDARNVYVAGASAGGHLAALAGVRAGTPAIRAVFCMYPPTDLTRFPHPEQTRGLIPSLLGGSVVEKRALAVAASPARQVHRGAPPMLLLHGTKDWLVPIEHSEWLAARLRAVGTPVRLVRLEGRGHGFGLTPAQLQEVAEFFRHYAR